jgi:hypothetical protein
LRQEQSAIAAHGLENLGQGRPIAPGLTQIGEVMKIQGQDDCDVLFEPL